MWSGVNYALLLEVCPHLGTSLTPSHSRPGAVTRRRRQTVRNALHDTTLSCYALLLVDRETATRESASAEPAPYGTMQGLEEVITK